MFRFLAQVQIKGDAELTADFEAELTTDYLHRYVPSSYAERNRFTPCNPLGRLRKNTTEGAKNTRMTKNFWEFVGIFGSLWEFFSPSRAFFLGI